MTKKFSAEPYLAELREFQRKTVDQVVDVFYRNKSGTRYLVADETGLGKSLIARGVIASAIEHMQDDKDIKRIDVIYVCSNADVARQNVKRLDVLGTKVDMPTRPSLLVASSHQLETPATEIGKPVNLISFTPATAFPEGGSRTGTAEERYLLFLILRDHMGLRLGRRETKAALRILQGGVATFDRFKYGVKQYEDGLKATRGPNYLDQAIISRFRDLANQPSDDGGPSALDDFNSLLRETVGKRSVPGGKHAAGDVVIGLRRTLARAGIEALEPDLVILDEFQRFTDLLRNETPASELAWELFNYTDARVLLLSATPYKPFDLDIGVDGGESGPESHRDQFHDTLGFLCGSEAADRENPRVKAIAGLLHEFRVAVTSGDDPSDLRDRLRAELLTLMCRTERPATEAASMVSERPVPAGTVSAADVEQFIKLTELAKLVDSTLPMDVWKSVPELVHFMDAYQMGRNADKQREEPDVKAKLTELRRLDPDALKRFDEIPSQNPRLEALIDGTTATGWHQFLWVPPSLPYLRPGGAFASDGAREMTKKLVFSQWSATPTAVAALLSYDARRRIAVGAAANGHADLSTHSRLQFSKGDLSSMADFMLFFPLPSMADLADPLKVAADKGAQADCSSAEAAVTEKLHGKLPARSVESGASEFAELQWQWQLTIDDQIAEVMGSRAKRIGGVTAADAMAGHLKGSGPAAPHEAADTPSALREYIDAVASVCCSGDTLDFTRIPPSLVANTTRRAMHSPANCAWRALGRLDVGTKKVSPAARWRAAAILASGLRTVFSRPETAQILDSLYPEKAPYWQKVLQYCADGNLQAVLDEYLFHLRAVEGDRAADDESLISFAHDAARAMKLREAIYKGSDPLGEGRDLAFPCRFALRYGDVKAEDGSNRSSEVREAFNSPFAPFVLVSTSVGQEGIDFHPWCHNLVHWNIPSSPVDFEQRDGRVNRFRGHAVRRNIAHAYGSEMLGDENPWDAAYALATTDAPHSETLPGLAPDWVYPGPYKVVREVMPYQLSTDEARIDRVKQRVAYYRLAFGQARQEDLISVVEAAGVTEGQAEQWRVDLRP
ncbi:MAG TPA: helicase-related protein [Gordonia sp. (in: high G+C Gram-positive bacteria)]|uniref:helicase-related protein n=1 Tax=unclassified Gordonia (in: high G+C Gram-positive bacteria) TaxID=2657482 RepID=UPI0025C264A3|nr:MULTISPECIES: helicase-related protein [unclassified Gordonia (in: high G+C Gram-positive bacteria)]HNP57055.1 helicase-related protein [Gordonia sp. (in: high G+C Gram-positive bacteria)]HRC49408.1 helicase-related protein [Gordonia sp. (in: high G+C Gram-positive bacteria)]